MHRYNEFATLTPAEAEVMLALAAHPVAIERGKVIRAEGDVPSSVFLLHEGWVTSSIGLPGGLKQTVKLHLPGDMMGVPSMALTSAAETLTAVTHARVSIVPHARLMTLFSEQPRIAALLFLSSQRERVALMDNLVGLGRKSALARVATFLLDLADRLQSLGQSNGDSFTLPLIQEELADLVGLTAVHVNRMVRELERAALIARTGAKVTLLDRAGLSTIAARHQREPVRNPDWLTQLSSSSA